MIFQNIQNIRPRDKEQKIFIKAYDQHMDQIYRFVYFKVGNKEDAQDLTSAIFLKTWDYIQKNKIKQKTLRALIYKIARNTIIDFYRGKGAQGNTSSLENAVRIADEKQDIQSNMELKFDIVVIEKKLMELKDEYREVIILRFTEEFSISEIASILSKSKGNTRVLIYRALKALKGLTESR